MGDLFQSSASTRTMPNPAQQRSIELLQEQSRRGFQQGDLAPDFFPGDTVAPQNQAEERSQQQLLQGSQQLERMQPAAQESTEFALNLPQNIGQNQAVQDAISAAIQPVQESFQEETLPSLRLDAAQSGQVGGSRQGVVEANAVDDLQENMGNVSARLMGDFFNQALQAQGQARGQLPTVANFAAAPGELTGQVGQERRALDQAEINEEIARHRAQETERLRGLTNLKNLITGDFGGTTTEESEVSDAQKAISLGTLAASFMSSEDYKENKRPVEQILPRIDMLRVEAWDYKPGFGDSQTHIGPYAEEFQKLFGVGNGDTISTVDAIGVLLLAVKELRAKLRYLEEKVDG